MKAGYMTVVSGAEVLGAVMLLTNRFVPLALALLAPMTLRATPGFRLVSFHRSRRGRRG